MEDISAELNLKCTYCDHQNNSNNEHNCAKELLVQNLPNNITVQGVKNLFLNIGTPLNINLNAEKNVAHVTLDSYNKAISAIRDLQNKPPYNLRITFSTKKFTKTDNVEHCETNNGEKYSDDKFLTKKFIADEITLNKNIESNNEVIERPDHIQALFKKVNYSPSYRIFQKKFDSQVPFGPSISLGRGYFYFGEQDYYIGGLQSSKYVSENSENLFQEDYYCENCNASTTRMCNKCLNTFCSVTCLNDNLSHINSDCFGRLKGYSKAGSLSDDHNGARKYVVLKPSCHVVITMFCSLKALFVRRIDDSWEERFVRLCNDVAVAAAEANPVEGFPVIGELYCARFYKDGFYYRSQVLSIINEKANVYFTDFGNIQETNINDIKPLPDKLKNWPKFAVKINFTDIPEGTSAEAIQYINNLIAEDVPLVLNYKNSISNGVILLEKETGDVVNEKIKRFILPSWIKDFSMLSKLGEVYYLESIPCQSLEVGKNYNLMLSHVDESEFEENGYLWLTNTEEDYYQYLKEEVTARIIEYCEYLKEDFYLPRESELCLAHENGKWERCACLNNIGTTCWLFFIDDGKTSFVETKNIRKMIVDFLDCPQQAIRCILSGYSIIKENAELRLKIMKYLKSLTGTTLNFVYVKNYENSDYNVVILEVEKLLAEEYIDKIDGK